MQGFISFAILSAAFVALGWSYVVQPLPEDNPKAFQECIKLHPQKYCTITYLPSKVSMEENK